MSGATPVPSQFVLLTGLIDWFRQVERLAGNVGGRRMVWLFVTGMACHGSTRRMRTEVP